MNALEVSSDDKEKPASETWEEGVAEWLQEAGDSEPNGHGQED